MAVTVTVPNPAGDFAVQEVLEEQATLLARFGPKEKVVPPATNPLPVKVTSVPPADGPVEGAIELNDPT